MCFRPPDVDGGLKCPNCGKKINSTMGVLPKKCPFCKTSFAELQAQMEAGGPAIASPSAPAPIAPGAPGMPTAPGAPGVPTAAKAPGIPTAPGAPGIPTAPGAPKVPDVAE